MARKPFLPDYAGKPWGVGPKAVRPEHQIVPAIGRCLTLWPHVEHQLAVLLGIAMKGDPDAALAIFTALRSARVQHDALTSAAETVLAPRDNELLAAILRLHKQAEDQRNDLGHGIWGEVDNSLTVAIWLNPKDYALFNVTALRKEGDKSYAAGSLHRELEKKMFTYDVSDVTDIYNEIYEDNENLFWFTAYLRRLFGQSRGGLPADEQYRLLCERPRIAKEIAQLRAHARKNPKARR